MVADRHGATRRLILLVDDDELVRRALARQLGVAFDVIEVPGYEQALHALRDVSTIAGVVSDFDLGGKQTGVDVLMDARRYCPRAPRILASGSITTDVGVKLVRAGLAHSVLRKGVGMDLVGALESCFASTSRLTAEEQTEPVGRIG